MHQKRDNKRILVIFLTLCLILTGIDPVFAVPDTSDVTVSENDIAPEDFESVPGYIEMPWDRDVPAADDSIPFETAKDRIVEDDTEEAAGDIPDVSVPAAYPYTYDNETSLRNYFNTELMPLRNQNPYGTCWAHSAISLLEGYMLSHGLSDRNGPVTTDVNYSELQLAYFYYHNNRNPITGSDGGDTITVSPSQDTRINRTGSFLDIGGNLGLAARSLINWRGAVNETTVPYSGSAVLINTDEGKKAVSGIDENYAQDHDVAHLKNEYEINIRLNPDLVKQAILADKIVGTSFYSRDDCYDSAHHSFCNLVNTKTNHAVAIVGWDDDFPKSNFKNTPDENGAWLIRNSWKYNNDDIYSYHGYFWLSYCDTSLAGAAYIYEAEADDYDNNYYHTNQIHGTGTWSMEKSANVFTAAGNAGAEAEKLEAVTVETGTADIAYTISIYSVGDNGKPTNDKLAEDITGTFPYRGIYTIPIEDNVIINKGEKFAVAIEAPAHSVCAEMPVSSTEYSTTVSINTGESFYGYSGNNNWYDFHELLKTNNYLGVYGNFCINALTSDATGAYSPSQFVFSAPGGTYNKTAYSATVTPKSEIAGGTVTVYYKKNGSNDDWSAVPPVGSGTYRVAIDYPGVNGYPAATKLTGSSWIFTIGQRDISLASISAIEDMDYTGSNITPEVTVSDLGNDLVKGTDYSIGYTNNRNKGTAYVTVTGKGNYTGTKKAPFRIIKRVTGIELDRAQADLSIGESITLYATVTPYDASDMTYSWRSTNGAVASVTDGTVTALKAGTARIEAKTTDKGLVSSCSVTVRKRNLSDNKVSITGLENKKYTGNPVEQDNLKIYYNGTLLSKETDYSVAYSNNTDYGTAEIVLTGKGDYDGRRVLTFSITGADDVVFTITSVPPISYGQRLDEIDLGYRAVFGGHTVSGSAVFADPSAKPSVSDSSVTEYEVIFTPNEIQQYACAVKKTRITVNPAGLKNITVTGAPELVYGERLADCEITGTAQSAVDSSDVPGTFEFAYSGLKPAVSDSDKTEYDIYFFPDDSTNFYAGSTKTTVTVKKAIPRISYEDQSVLDSLTLQKGHSLSEITSSLPAGFGWHPDVDISAIYDTADEIIYAHVLYNPDPDNYNYATGTATIRVTGQAVPQHEVGITVKNGVAKYKGRIINSALPGTKVDLMAKVPDGMLFKTWIVTNAIVDSDKEQTTMTVGNADVTAEAVLEKDPDDTDEEPPEKEEFNGKIKSLSIINEDGKKVKALKLAKGETADLYADVVMSKGDEPDAHFRSDNTKVVRVTDGGKVTGYGQGSAAVTVYCGNKTAKCTVTVTEEIKNVKVTARKDKLLVGEKLLIRADTEPYTSASDRTVSWSVDRKNLASVAGGTQGCVLTAKKAGTVKVTAKIKTKDPLGKSVTVNDSCYITIEAPVMEQLSSADKSYKLSFKKANVTITGLDKEGKITAVLSNSEKAESVSIDWTSSNEDVIKIINADSIASVSRKKATANATVSSCGIGYAFVTARVTDNETGLVNVKRCKVTVNAPVMSIRISKDSLGLLDGDHIEMRKGQRDALSVDIYPDSPTNINRVTWTAKGGVTVKNGVICANRVMPGLSKVIVKCGNAKHTIFVNVTK